MKNEVSLLRLTQLNNINIQIGNGLKKIELQNKNSLAIFK